MATISTVAVDFVANTAKYTQGLTGMQKQTKAWSAGIKKDTQGATDAFDGVSKALTRFATQAVSIVAIQKIGAAFVQAAKEVSMLADEAEKVGASAAQFDKLRLAAERNGGEIGDVKIAYKELQKSINEALGGSKETVKAFNELGLSYSYLASLNPDERFKEIAQALSKVGDENKRAELGVRLLGKAYTELSPLIAKGAAGIDAGGRGSLSQNQIEIIDKITKSFEELGRTLDGKLKQALVELAPSIMKISEAMAYIIRNLTSFAALVGLAFAPAAVLKLAAGFSLLANVINFQVVKAILAANGGMAAMISLNTASFLSNLTLPLISVAGAFSKVAAAAALAFKTLTIFLLVFEAVTRIVGKGAEMLGFDQYAEALKQIREGVEDTVLGFLGFETAEDKVKNFLAESANKIAAAQKRLNDSTAKSANEAGQALDAEQQEIKDLEEAFKDAQKASVDYAKSITEKFQSPFEKSILEFVKLTTAVDVGRISVDTYKKAVEDLKDGLNQLDLDKLRKAFPGGGPYQALGVDKGLSISSQTKFSQETQRAEMFGAGTNVGGELPKGIQPFTSPYAELQAQLKSTGTALLENGRTAKEVYDSEVQAINAAVEAYKLQGREEEALRLQTIALADAFNVLQDANIEAFARANPYIIQAFGYMSDFADQFSRAIVAGESFGEALSGVFKNILKDITAMILRTTILQAIMQSIGIISPTTNAAAAFGKMTGLVPRANGGPVMAGGGYRVGERGPETFVPQTNGYILPNDMAPSETVVVNQNIYVQTGVAQTVRAEMASLMPRFKADAMAGVLEAKQRGGSYSRGLSFA